ncbi:CPBP family intramembrane glutamic endopeptidase [Xanthomonas sp. XNM01]|uniref:CPBP family intramembrane glutamic endopeptidase n=1 Tax=Xanthomonas sp. XNM01 TaxID=2769289 RepID=UPI001782DB1C|nr:CPBP family intramembrane glutamic endopeptidase [Xanthomonas sp. XNM01]MBD9369775.1 CPBP family intramembrane metalloprotease [Xanthomonas sp. XNM01]
MMSLLWRSAVLLLVLLLAPWIGDLCAMAGWPLPPLRVPYGGAIVDNLLSVTAVCIAALALRRAWQPGLPRLIGLHWNGLRWMAGGVATFEPRALLMLALLFPLAEEIVFRGFGYAFARGLGWPAGLAVLVQALAFGAVHWLGAGGGAGEALLIFAITAVGGALFAVADACDGRAIWSGWVLHASLNAAWSVFDVSGSAASGLAGIALRIGAVLLAIMLLRRFVRAQQMPVAG